MICLDLQPYSLVQDTGFKRLMNHLAPNYSIPNRTHFSTKVVPLLYETVKAKVKFELDNAKYVSLTTDGWTCQHNIKSFYSLTARFVTDTFELVHVILQVKYFPESHTAINIGKFINESLQSWDISPKKVSVIVTDNAANMLSAIKETQLTDGQHLSCVIHTMQLCIENKLFKEQRATSDAIAVFRSIAGHFHHSSTAVAKLQEIQKQLTLPQHTIIQDVGTRWNSTYYMLERFCEQKEAIVLYIMSRQERSKGNLKTPSQQQWQLAEMLVCILKQFERATNDLSSNNACISQIIPFIYSMEKYLNFAGETATGIKTVVEELKNEFSRRFSMYKENVHLKIAMILDPRFKLKFVDENNASVMKETLMLEYFKFVNSSSENNDDKDGNSSSTSSTSPSPIHSDSDDSPARKRKLMSVDIYSFFHDGILEDKEKERNVQRKGKSKRTKSLKDKW